MQKVFYSKDFALAISFLTDHLCYGIIKGDLFGSYIPDFKGIWNTTPEGAIDMSSFIEWPDNRFVTVLTGRIEPDNDKGELMTLTWMHYKGNNEKNEYVSSGRRQFRSTADDFNFDLTEQDNLPFPDDVQLYGFENN